MSEKVVTLPGVSREVQTDTQVSNVLASAQDAGLRSCVVVGIDPKGDLAVWTSDGNINTVLGLMYRGLHWLAGARFVEDPDA